MDQFFMNNYSTHPIAAAAIATAGLVGVLVLKEFVHRWLPDPVWEDYPEALTFDSAAAAAHAKLCARRGE
jgi:hypothetical protein